MKHSDIAVFIGNTLDHFDSSLYFFLAPVMAPIFFPNTDPIVQLILAYSILITALITKPLGAIIFGTIASRKGAVFSLSYSLIGVAITSVLIGCVPSYKSIGYMAPFGLIIMTILREIFASGESAVAKLYVLTNKSSSSALTSSCFYNISSILGMILASIAATVTINNSPTNIWRICFWLGGSVGFVGVFLRRYFPADNVTYQHDQITKNIQLKSLWEYKAKVLKIALVTGFGYITYSVPFIFFNSFVPIITDISLHSMFMLNNFLLIFDLIVLFIAGRLVINYQPSKILLCSSLVLFITIIPLFLILQNSSLLVVTIVRLWIIFWGAVFAIPANVWCEKLLLDLPEKYFLMSIGASLGTGIIGKTTTAVSLYLWYKTNYIFVPATYIAILMAITFVVIAININNNHKTNL